MEGYPYVQAPTTTNQQVPTSQPEKNPIISNVNGNQQEHAHCTESMVPPSSLATHADHCEAITAISTTLTGSCGDRACSFAPGVPAGAEIYNPSPHSTPIASCSFPQSYVPLAPSVPHVVSGQEHLCHPTAYPTGVSNPQHVPSPIPIAEPLMPAATCSLNEKATNLSHIDVPPVHVPTVVHPVKCIEDASKSVENNDKEFVVLDCHENAILMPSLDETSNKSEEKQIRVENEDAADVLKKQCSAEDSTPLKEQDSKEICNATVSNDNSQPVQHIVSSPLAKSGKIENSGPASAEFTEESRSETLKSTVIDLESPKEDYDEKKPVEEGDKVEGMVLPDKNISTVVEPASRNEECIGNTPAKNCDKEKLCDVQTPNDVSCLLKNAVLVQAASFEPIESVEDVKPVVGGCLDDIGRVDESQENLAIEPAGLFVDETCDGPDYDATDGIEVAKIDPIIPLEVPFFDSNGMPAGSESEEEPFEPDMAECGEMIGLSTDDEIELKRSMCAKTVAKAKHSKTELIGSHSKPGFSIVEENGTKYGSDKKSRIQLDTRAPGPTKKRKIHSIRIVDIKKEVLNIDEQNSDDSPEKYASKRIKTQKRKPASSSSDIPSGSGFDSSCEEILDDDCLHDGLETQSKRSRFSNNGASRVKNRKAKKVEVIAGLKLPAHQQQQLQNLVLKKKQKTRDRFYDRSQDIPNDIYFENMNVPLHVLHDTSSSSSDEEHSAVSKYRNTNYSAHKNRNSSSSVARSETNHKSLQSMKMFLKTAGFRHIRYQKLWKDCHTNQERAEAILRFLHDNGLQGEPTFEKCSELRKQIQLENEAKALDVSAIISAGEGRVTRQRTKMLTNTSTPPNSVEQKTAETGQLPTPHESKSHMDDVHVQCHSEQNVQIELQQTVPQGTSQPEDEPTQCHNNEDKEMGQQQTVEQSASHSVDEPTKSHIEQAGDVPQETNATGESIDIDDSVNNQVLPSTQ